MLAHAITPELAYEFAEDVRAGLSLPGQKELPSKYLYDPVGSALFEVISILPEYGLTRADERVLRRHASDIVSRLADPVVVAELGSGSGSKTRWVLQALSRRKRISTRSIHYCPIEISPTALSTCKRQLGDIESLSIVGFEREYLDGLREVAARRQEESQLLVLFLGSTIGNFDRSADTRFLREVRQSLRPGDAMLLGTDLIKPIPRLLAAYDDPLGVTAAFNLNLLARINRELDANFVLDDFEHWARFNRETSSIEMHLRSRRTQTVVIPKADLTVVLRAGETIWTESSHKYSRDEVSRICEDAGFSCEAQWIDEEWLFAENLLVAQQ